VFEAGGALDVVLEAEAMKGRLHSSQFPSRPAATRERVDDHAQRHPVTSA